MATLPVSGAASYIYVYIGFLSFLSIALSRKANKRAITIKGYNKSIKRKGGEKSWDTKEITVEKIIPDEKLERWVNSYTLIMCSVYKKKKPNKISDLASQLPLLLTIPAVKTNVKYLCMFIYCSFSEKEMGEGELIPPLPLAKNQNHGCCFGVSCLSEPGQGLYA